MAAEKHQSDVKPLEQALRGAREREKLFRQIVQHMNDAVVIVDVNSVIKGMNPAAERLFACAENDMVGQEFQFKVHSGKPAFRPIPMQQVTMKGSDGNEKIIEMSVAEIKLHGETFFMASMRDITELIQLRREKEEVPLIDDLTGLYNRRGLTTLAEYQIKMADRQRKGMLLLMFSLRNFQEIASSFGQSEANSALVEFADILRQTFRISDIIARIDENKFAAIAIGAQKNHTDILVVRFKSKLGLHNSQKGRKYKLLAYVGAAFYNPNAPCSIDELLAEARKNIIV